MERVTTVRTRRRIRTSTSVGKKINTPPPRARERRRKEQRNEHTLRQLLKEQFKPTTRKKKRLSTCCGSDARSLVFQKRKANRTLAFTITIIINT